jgi:ribonucleoside-triphosphate reductase
MKVIKRNGKEVEFDGSKIINAVQRANLEAPNECDRLTDLQIQVIEEKVENTLKKLNHTPTIEEIQDLVIYAIMNQQTYLVAKLYTEYRYKHMLLRKDNTTDNSILTLVNYENEEINQENSNKNPMIASTQRDYIAGEASKDLTMRVLLPMDIVEAHKKGIIHFHDADYFLQKIHNCDLINLWDMLWNGTVISGVQITRPHSLSTAANVATQIIAQVASNQFGGQTFSLAHLAPFVDISRQRNIEKLRKDFDDIKIDYTDEQIEHLAEMQVKREIESAIQTIQYQLVTLMTTNGQTPFVSMFMCLEEAPEGRTRDDMALLMEEVLRQRIKGLPNEKGQWVVAAFPKLLYATSDLNINADSPYFYLTEMAAKCSAKTLVPDYISTKIMQEYKGDVYPCMGCRSFLTPDRFTDAGIGNIANAGDYEEGKHKYYGRFNQGVVTINLVDVACSSEKDFDKFWKIFDERLELCHRALRLRHERLLGTPSDAAPILWQYGALARLKKGETIDKLLYNGYSTLSL